LPPGDPPPRNANALPGADMLIDISPTIGPDAPLFPGDAPFALQWTARIGPGCPVNLSAVSMSPHIGAHADAPLHYADDAPAIDAVALDPFIGPCRVIHAIGCGPLIELHHLQHALDPIGAPGAPGARGPLPPRVLVRTAERADTRWNPQFSAFAPATLNALADRGLRLVGIDTASVDPADSKTLEAHQVLRQRDLRVLENLVLDAVDEGDYELIALPLKLAGACASPVRAVLRPLAT
jgi:arylformamidase